ncbi:hypothetical protein P8C59_007961 [Phyllachora maydis]|uniref:Uncharacterized protein n=1 Tax=Phyllachora maydis TaxID=1825666 RepID=A0AAD9I9L7_9PEZI|nr:hypothetical protein P8C59_007961 [Phyllachora maydis]
MLADADGQDSSNGTFRGATSMNGAQLQDGHAAAAGSFNGARRPAESTNSLARNGSSQNGSSSHNSKNLDALEQEARYLGHDREEVTRLLIQALSDMGYHTAAESVSRDSGCELESPIVNALRVAVLDGAWGRAEELLSGAASAGERQQAGNGLVLAKDADTNMMRIWLRQQKFLELLERRETARALMVLRSELTPLCQEQHSKLHFLSSLLMCQSPEDLKRKADWDGAYGQSRRILLSELSRCISPLDGHADGIGNMAWSPDDTMMITCGRDRLARIWNTKSGACIRLLERFSEPALCQWNLEGDRLYTWTKKHRTEDLTASPDGHWMVAMDDQNHIHVYSFLTRELEWEMDMKTRPTSVSVSRDSRFLLVNKIDGEAQLIDIATREPIQKYSGATGGEFVIRSSFAGANESYVVSGSEDGSICIWHKVTGILIQRFLDAHKPRCNAVRWSPTDPCLFASCGDDNKIKIWSSKERVRDYISKAKCQNGWGRVSAEPSMESEDVGASVERRGDASG